MASAFDPQESIGSKSPEEIAAYLRDIDDPRGAEEILGAGPAGQLLGRNKPWHHTGMLLGFIDSSKNNTSIVSAVGMSADGSIKGKRIKITLDAFFVEAYPGYGVHSVLCEFCGKNQAPGETEELRFALTVESSDKSSAAISGKPIFIGVNVGDDGIDFEGRTVNVRSSGDETVLATLNHDAFKQGLSLITNAQPVLKPFASLAAGVVSAIANRRRNTQVHCFTIGLDFGKGATAARLRYGSYVVLQAPSSDWNWENFEWNPDTATIRAKATRQNIGLNYMVFGVSEFKTQTSNAAGSTRPRT